MPQTQKRPSGARSACSLPQIRRPAIGCSRDRRERIVTGSPTPRRTIRTRLWKSNRSSRGNSIMHPLLRPTNIVIAVLGAAVVGLGTAVVVDHTAAAPAPRAQTASLSAASNTATSILLSGAFSSAVFSSGAFAASGQAKDGAPQVFNFFTTDTKLTWQQIGADLLPRRDARSDRGLPRCQGRGGRACRGQGGALARCGQRRDHLRPGDASGQ